MAVDVHALTSVDECFAYIGERPVRDGIWVYCSQGDATAATAEVTATTLVLIITGGVQAGPNPLTFADANKNTLSELVTAINALTGWKAGIIYHSDAASTDLVVTGALSCLGSANEITLKIEDIYLIERLIDRATDLIERYCQRKFDTRSYIREIYYGSGSSRLMLEQYPVTRVTRLSSGRNNAFSILNSSTDCNYATVEVTDTAIRLIVDGGTNDDDESLTLSGYLSIDALIAAIHALGKGWTCTALATDTSTRDASDLLRRPSMYVGTSISAYVECIGSDITEYKVISPAEDRNYGVIQIPGTFITSQEYHIDYVAGYTTIPYSLEMACVELVKYKYDQSKRAYGVKRERMGNVYEYENFNLADLQNGLPPDLVNELDLFRRREF